MTYFSSVLSAATLILQFYGSLVPENIFFSTQVTDVKRQLHHCPQSQDQQISSFRDPFLGDFGPSLTECSFPPCSPGKPSEIGTKFLFKSNSTRGEILVSAEQFITENNTLAIESVEDHIQSDIVWIVVQGWTESNVLSPEINDTIAAMNRAGADVILVDWFHGSPDSYMATVNAQVVGAQIGYLIDSLDISEQAECIGFSIGANVCGFAGQWLKKEKEYSLSRCIGIDPSVAFLRGCPNDLFLTKDDCEVVSIIRTIGTDTQITSDVDELNQGHCNYWINYQSRQPECQAVKTISSALGENTPPSLEQTDKILLDSLEIFSCEHRTTARYFREQITSSPEGSFNFKECSKLEESNYCLDGSESESESSVTEYIYSMPPFDTCTADDSKSFCLCIK